MIAIRKYIRIYFQICESPPASLEQDAGARVEVGVQVEVAAGDEADALRIELANLTRRYDDEKTKLSDLVK